MLTLLSFWTSLDKVSVQLHVQKRLTFNINVTIFFLLYRSTVLCYSENEAKIYSAYTLFLCWWWTSVWKVSFELYTICSVNLKSDVRLVISKSREAICLNFILWGKENLNAFKTSQSWQKKRCPIPPTPTHPKPHPQNLIMLFCNLILVNSISTAIVQVLYNDSPACNTKKN